MSQKCDEETGEASATSLRTYVAYVAPMVDHQLVCYVCLLQTDDINAVTVGYGADECSFGCKQTLKVKL